MKSATELTDIELDAALDVVSEEGRDMEQYREAWTEGEKAYHSKLLSQMCELITEENRRNGV